MKRYMSFVLAVVLVLGLAAVTSAAEGTLKNSGTVSAEIDVYATIGPYAKITKVAPVQFGELLGKVGLYTANGFDNTTEQFYDRAADVFGISAELFAGNNDGWGSFTIETNCDVRISMIFDNTGWLKSPTVFGIARQGQPANVLAWAASNQDLADWPTSFVHEYMKGEQLYGIGGAIYIQSISQQLAKAYSGTLTVTVEAEQD